jgi:hypothetical protein
MQRAMEGALQFESAKLLKGAYYLLGIRYFQKLALS